MFSCWNVCTSWALRLLAEAKATKATKTSDSVQWDRSLVKAQFFSGTSFFLHNEPMIWMEGINRCGVGWGREVCVSKACHLSACVSKCRAISHSCPRAEREFSRCIFYLSPHWVRFLNSLNSTRRHDHIYVPVSGIPTFRNPLPK